jgi:hypothetical protein
MRSTVLVGEFDTYTRSRFQHAVRWIVFIGLSVLNIGLIMAFVHYLMIAATVSPATMARQCISLGLFLICDLCVFPSIVLECNKVELTPEKIRFHTLLFRGDVRWEDITGIIAPAYLKFIIIKTNSGYYLINKRDMDRFDELQQKIRRRAALEAK